MTTQINIIFDLIIKCQLIFQNSDKHTKNMIRLKKI